MGNKQTLELFSFKNVQIDEISSSKEAAHDAQCFLLLL